MNLAEPLTCVNLTKMSDGVWNCGKYQQKQHQKIQMYTIRNNMMNDDKWWR